MLRKANDPIEETITQSIYIKLVPRASVKPIPEIGKGLIVETMKVLQAAAEAEGYDIVVEMGTLYVW